MATSVRCGDGDVQVASGYVCVKFREEVRAGGVHLGIVS